MIYHLLNKGGKYYGKNYNLINNKKQTQVFVDDVNRLDDMFYNVELINEEDSTVSLNIDKKLFGKILSFLTSEIKEKFSDAIKYLTDYFIVVGEEFEKYFLNVTRNNIQQDGMTFYAINKFLNDTIFVCEAKYFTHEVIDFDW